MVSGTSGPTTVRPIFSRSAKSSEPGDVGVGQGDVLGDEPRPAVARGARRPSRPGGCGRSSRPARVPGRPSRRRGSSRSVSRGLAEVVGEQGRVAGIGDDAREDPGRQGQGLGRQAGCSPSSGSSCGSGPLRPRPACSRTMMSLIRPASSSKSFSFMPNRVISWTPRRMPLDSRKVASSGRAW